MTICIFQGCGGEIAIICEPFIFKVILEDEFAMILNCFGILVCAKFTGLTSDSQLVGRGLIWGVSGTARKKIMYFYSDLFSDQDRGVPSSHREYTIIYIPLATR